MATYLAGPETGRLYTSKKSLRGGPVRGGSGVFVGTNPYKGVHGFGSCELNDRLATIALLCSVDESLSDIWMIENFDPTQSQDSR
jgi:hypothetical protein